MNYRLTRHIHPPFYREFSVWLPSASKPPMNHKMIRVWVIERPTHMAKSQVHAGAAGMKSRGKWEADCHKAAVK